MTEAMLLTNQEKKGNDRGMLLTNQEKVGND